MQTLSEGVLLEPLGDLSLLPAAIVVTVPSSPDDGPHVRPHIPRTPPLRALELRATSDIASRAPFDSDNLSPPPPVMSHSANATMSPFEQRLDAAILPPPGPDYFAARRALWWTPGSISPCLTEPNTSRRRLEALLAQPGAIEDEQVWSTGVDRVWSGLIGGAKLKQRLPLALVIKILQAGWIREGTWPRGAVVPESDDDVPHPQTREATSLLSTATPSITTTHASAEDEVTTRKEIGGKS